MLANSRVAIGNIADPSRQPVDLCRSPPMMRSPNLFRWLAAVSRLHIPCVHRVRQNFLCCICAPTRREQLGIHLGNVVDVLSFRRDRRASARPRLPCSELQPRLPAELLGNLVSKWPIINSMMATEYEVLCCLGEAMASILNLDNPSMSVTMWLPPYHTTITAIANTWWRMFDCCWRSYTTLVITMQVDIGRYLTDCSVRNGHSKMSCCQSRERGEEGWGLSRVHLVQVNQTDQIRTLTSDQKKNVGLIEPQRWKKPWKKPKAKSMIIDPDLYRLFLNTWPSTVDTTFLWHGKAIDNDNEEVGTTYRIRYP